MPDGKVDFDSQNRPDELDKQLNRPEIKQALAGSSHDEVRYNAALDQRVIYLAAPVMRNDQLFGVLYLSQPLVGIELGAESRWKRLTLVAGLAIAALAGLLAWRVALGIARPVADVAHAADRLADGQWGARTAVPDTRELAELAERFNRMAELLQQRIGVLIQNNNEQKAVLASMAEGVLAVDSQERVISMNTASRRLLGLDQSQVARPAACAKSCATPT